MSEAVDDGESDLQLNCPLCGYDLRGLPEHRCPECGYAFDPDELRRARSEKRLWLFEHAISRLRVAWIKTSVCSLFPREFWKRVVAAHLIVPRRLGAFALSWLTLAVSATLASIIVGTTLSRAGVSYAQHWVPGPGPYGWLDATDPRLSWLDVLFANLRQHSPSTSLLPIAALCLWPLAAMFGLRLFGSTLRRAKVDQGHLTRLSSYSLPAVLIVPTLTAVFVETDSTNLFIDLNTYLRGVLPVDLQMFLGAIGVNLFEGLALAVSMLWSVGHLIAAHVRYLRVPHAVAQAMLVSVVAWLCIAAALGTAGGILSL